MHLSLHEIGSDTEFDELICCEWKAYETPYNAVFNLLCPTLGSHATAREDSIKESTQRQLDWHKGDPKSHWVKVIDDNNDGKVVGGALWLIHEDNPYAKPLEYPLTCYWWPGGPKREMADQVIRQFVGPRFEKMSKPHILLEICFVEPSYRRRGVGKLLVQWGTDRADEMGLEAFVEATDDGGSLYGKHGFEYLNKFELKATPPEDTVELKKLQHDLAFSGHLMWHKVAGISETKRRLV